jgi:hypothetical protein
MIEHSKNTRWDIVGRYMKIFEESYTKSDVAKLNFCKDAHWNLVTRAIEGFPEESFEQKKCDCPINILMCRGCQCGAISLERNRG